MISLDEFCAFLLVKDSENSSDWITGNQRKGKDQRLERREERRDRREEKERNQSLGDDDEPISSENSSQKQRVEISDTVLEHQAKLFLQGMKSLLTKHILDSREAGRISSLERLSQKTSQLIETQSRVYLHQLFAPFMKTRTSQSGLVQYEPFKRSTCVISHLRVIS